MQTPTLPHTVFTAPAGFEGGIITHPCGHRLRGGSLERHTHPDARVMIGTGLSEPIEKYFETMRDLDRAGCNVYAFNWRNQCGSDPYLPDAPDLRHAIDLRREVDDLHFLKNRLLGAASAHYIGHSFGGLIGLFSEQQYPNRFAGIVASTPLIGFKNPLIRLLGERFYARLPLSERFLERAVDPKKTYRPRNDPDSKEQPQDFSSDRQRMRLHDAWLEANPDWQTRSLTFGWVRAVCRAIDLLTDPDSPGIKAKALILTAGRDILVDNRKIDSIKIKASDLTHLHLPDAKHEIFMERDSLRAPALAAIQAFIRTGTPKP